MRRKLVAWQGLRPCGMNRAVTQSHMEEVYTEHRVRTERRREQQGRRFFQTSGESMSFAMAGYPASLKSFHSFRENKTVLWAHPLVMLMFLLRPPQKCLPYGKNSQLRGSQLGS